jgi:cell wall-associated NlpC family hydrolase
LWGKQLQQFKCITRAAWLVLALATGCASRPPAVETAPHTDRTQVLKTVQKLVGTPYRYGGSSPRGFDCSGLVWYAHRQAGIRVPRTADQQFRRAEHKPTGRMAPGDLVFFADRRGHVFHVGTYIGHDLFIHAPSSGQRVLKSSLSEPYWKTHLAGVGSFY